MSFPRSLCLAAVLVFLSAAVSAQKGPIAIIKAQNDGPLLANLRAEHPIVFEMGKLDRPWRKINDLRVRAGSIEWPAVKDRTYAIWERDGYARAQLSAVRQAFGHQDPAPRNPTQALLLALRWVRRERSSTDAGKFALAEHQLSSALREALGVTIDIEAGVGRRVWPEQALPLRASFSCSRGGVRARFDSFTTPDNWKLTPVSLPDWSPAKPGRALPAQTKISLPAQSVFYLGRYPIIAWYEVEYDGVRFKASNAAEAQLIHPLQKEASIATVSDTQIDLKVHLTSLLPIPNVETELYLPDGWTGSVPGKRFTLNLSKDITYRITRPREEDAGLRIVGAIYRIGDYGTSQRLIAEHALTLGDSHAVTGLKMVQVKGEESRRAEMLGRKCRQTHSNGRIYFDVSDNFPPGEETYLTVECVAAEPGELVVDYRTVSDEVAETEAQSVGCAQWQKHIFVLRGAKFGGAFAGGADFRLSYSGGSLGVSGIRVSRFRTL